MIRYRDECVSCGLPCLGERCFYKGVIYYVCDECGREFTEKWQVNEIAEDEHLCFLCA